MSTPKQMLDSGDPNTMGAAAQAIGLGTLLSGGPGFSDGSTMTQVEETLAVASAAATPTYKVESLLYVKTVGTGAAGYKSPGIPGATPGTGAAAPNAGGTSIVFNAETTGTGTVDVAYMTRATIAKANGATAKGLNTDIASVAP